ncbi:MAG: NmrA/HSCARG family protein, partial [Solirubrobacteraceae bacterium]
IAPGPSPGACMFTGQMSDAPMSEATSRLSGAATPRQPGQPQCLVLGATGHQGGAVLDALLQRGAAVRALVRDPDSPRARGLGARGIELVAGDLADIDELGDAMRGMKAVYGLTVSGPGEVDQGLAIVGAARRVSLAHLVLASVASAHRSSSVPHFASKATVEHAARASGVPTTVLAPTWFFENLLGQRDQIDAGRLALGISPDRRLQCLAVADLGTLAAEVMLSPPVGSWQRIELAGDELTPAEMAARLSAILGRAVRAVRIPPDELASRSSDLAAMYRFLERTGYGVDLPALRAGYPETRWKSFQEWAGDQAWGQASG